MLAIRKSVLAAAAVLLAAAGCTTAAGSAGPGTAGAPASSALAELAKLPVKTAGTMAGYSRDKFGPAWADVDHNGCDTRNDVLARDLTGTRRDSDGCTILSGTLHDPYTGHTIAFTRGASTSAAVQIDHLVPLANAWRTGARAWNPDKREQLANDPQNLLASDGPTNESKGDQDASTWLPPAAGYRCAYVVAQVHVKARYGLAVTQTEHDAMSAVLKHCEEQPSEPAHTAPSSPATDASSAGGDVHPGSFCSTPGAAGRTEAGTQMVCSAAPGQPRPRWRSR